MCYAPLIFRLGECCSNYFLFSFSIDTKNDIGSRLPDQTIITNRIMDCINVDDRMDFIQGTVLPVFNLRQQPVCHIRNKPFGYIKIIDIFNCFRYLSGSHSFGIHGYDFAVDGGNVLLTFLNDLRIKSRSAILRHFNLHGTIAAVDTFVFLPFR